MYQNLWHEAKAMLGWKFITLYNCTRKEERSKTNYLSFYLKKLEIEEQIEIEAK